MYPYHRPGPGGLPLGLASNEGLGISLRCAQVCICMRGILLLAQRYSKSSRGTPRLRRAPQTLHGAPAPCSANHQLEFLAAHSCTGADSVRHRPPHIQGSARRALSLPFAVSGDYFGALDRRGLTPILAEIGLFERPAPSVRRCFKVPPGGERESRLGRLVAVQFTPTGALFCWSSAWPCF